MGLDDRDYARFGPRSPSGLGNVRVVSVNTWLIVINIAVFILNNVLFHAVQVPVNTQRGFLPDVTAEQVNRAQRTPPFDRRDGTLEYRFVDLYAPGGPREIGFERFRPMPLLDAIGHFSTGKFWSEGQVWRLITFQFLHANIAHLALNMLGLWFVGGLVEQYLGRRRYAVFYLACGVCGALAYMILNLAGYVVTHFGLSQVPLLLFEDPYVPLIGASAGVFGVLMASAYIAPDAIVDVLLILPMRLRTAVYIYFALAVLNLWSGGHNAGGDAAHVGGALAGALLIRRPHILRDLATLYGLLSGHRPRRRVTVRRRIDPEPEAVDRVLDKIRTHGWSSLTEADRAILRRGADAYRAR